jgi:hypothetical protein
VLSKENATFVSEITKPHSMKRIYLLSLLFIASLACSAQGIYTSVTKYDKFDDVVWQKTIKTLITQNDTAFVVETKGQKPVVYTLIEGYVLNVGSRDSLVNLVDDLWGYEDSYLVFAPKDKEDFHKYMEENTKGKADSTDLVLGDNIIKINTYKTFRFMYLRDNIEKLPKITVRTVSKYKYDFAYRDDVFWIKFSDGSRLIYNR